MAILCIILANLLSNSPVLHLKHSIPTLLNNILIVIFTLNKLFNLLKLTIFFNNTKKIINILGGTYE